jgi:pilus assembly protein CpaB
MQRQSIIALGVAVVLGLVAVYLANTFLVSTDNQRAASATTRIAVAAVPLDYGTDLTADKIRFVDYPSSAVPVGSFTGVQALFPAGEKRVALMTIQANEPILATKISGAGKNASIASLLPAGKRAASVRINDVSGVAGFVQPNDTVDVLVTRQVGEGNQQITDVLLQNVRVIAIDQNAKGEEGKAALAKTATLEVDQLAAQKLALAQEIGSLGLVLRRPGDNQDNPVVETVSLNDLRYSLYGGVQYPAAARVGAYAVPAAAASRAIVQSAAAPRAPVRRVVSRKVVAARPATSSVEIVRGTESSRYDVGGGNGN